MGPLAGLLGTTATVGGVGGANVGAASLAAGAADASLATGAGGLLSGLGKAEPYLKLAQLGMGAMEPQTVPQPQLQGPRGPGQPLQALDTYADPEMEKRRQYELWLAQQGGIYG